MSVIDLEKELTKIINKQSIKAIFQPIFNIGNQKVHGFEALSRGPEHSTLYSPVPLFKTAEHHGKLSELETLCRSISINAFKTSKLNGKLFINISPKALLDPEHPKGLTLQLINQMGLRPEDVVIELSEQYPADDIDLLKDCLNHYRNQGFLTAIDDLGAGYSGLRLWSELSPDYVKIDRHFIHQIDSTAVKQEFVRSIVELCQNLTCKVIAEGIETPAELTMLKQLGVTYCQGYLLGRPNAKPNTYMDSELVSIPMAPQNRYCETAESLCVPANIATPDTKLKQLSEQFINQPALQAIVIADNGQAQGIVSRNHILELFSTPYGRALHENHPANAVMDKQVLQIDACEPLSTVSQLLTSEHSTTVAQQFIILRHDKLIGIGHTKDLLQRITEHRIKVARHANPLSNLPGNVPIQEELKRLRAQKKSFYLAYFDLCHFKPYNDIYGFSRGDEVIMEVANLLTQHQHERCFVGHVGGDDFVMICTCFEAINHSQAIIEQFEHSKRAFYSEEHWLAQTIHAKDRQDNMVDHPLISLCVGVLSPEVTVNTTDHELSMLSAEAKKQAKFAKNGFYALNHSQQKTA
ncbi:MULTISPECIES: GGDEF domain-containing protein [Shewanella]|uniref:GGDEF domain-containing protein n=1 Tax=Shewanella TaxID=22 RepID=UPI001BBE1FD8|nr:MULTISPECIES: bifunctional diguanylate cyclase/phosphodiesterase [Shewanella]GIU49993.1 D-glycero-D-manno-heptose 1-phosphate guanosyltransferase [Shewanella sp. KT0246]